MSEKSKHGAGELQLQVEDKDNSDKEKLKSIVQLGHSNLIWAKDEHLYWPQPPNTPHQKLISKV